MRRSVRAPATNTKACRRCHRRCDCPAPALVDAVIWVAASAQLLLMLLAYANRLGDTASVRVVGHRTTAIAWGRKMALASSGRTQAPGTPVASPASGSQRGHLDGPPSGRKPTRSGTECSRGSPRGTRGAKSAMARLVLVGFSSIRACSAWAPVAAWRRGQGRPSRRRRCLTRASGRAGFLSQTSGNRRAA
jgi:hypothetical protein